MRRRGRGDLSVLSDAFSLSILPKYFNIEVYSMIAVLPGTGIRLSYLESQSWNIFYTASYVQTPTSGNIRRLGGKYPAYLPGTYLGCIKQIPLSRGAGQRRSDCSDEHCETSTRIYPCQYTQRNKTTAHV
eukprot:scaffold54479_cov59-Attheya_sp.AAC.1